MRPEKFHYEVEKVFLSWYKTNAFKVTKPLLREMERVWVKWSKLDDDYREGHETYGFQGIDHDLLYISDRWENAFRLKWLIDGIKGGYFDGECK